MSGRTSAVGGVEVSVLDDPVAWASSDGDGGVVYSTGGRVWWQPARTGDSILIDAAGWFARSVDGRPTLIASTDEEGCGEGGYVKLALRDLTSGDERLFIPTSTGGLTRACGAASGSRSPLVTNARDASSPGCGANSTTPRRGTHIDAWDFAQVIGEDFRTEHAALINEG